MKIHDGDLNELAEIYTQFISLHSNRSNSFYCLHFSIFDRVLPHQFGENLTALLLRFSALPKPIMLPVIIWWYALFVVVVVYSCCVSFKTSCELYYNSTLYVEQTRLIGGFRSLYSSILFLSRFLISLLNRLSNPSAATTLS